MTYIIYSVTPLLQEHAFSARLYGFVITCNSMAKVQNILASIHLPIQSGDIGRKKGI